MQLGSSREIAKFFAYRQGQETLDCHAFLALFDYFLNLQTIVPLHSLSGSI